MPGAEDLGVDSAGKPEGDPAVLARLGTARRLQGRYAEASGLYRRALDLDPGQLDAWQGVALLLSARGNAEAAVRRLGELVAKHPDSVPLRATLGDLQQGMGRYGAALECYERVLDGHPEHAGCRLGLRRSSMPGRMRSTARD